MLWIDGEPTHSDPDEYPHNQDRVFHGLRRIETKDGWCVQTPIPDRQNAFVSWVPRSQRVALSEAHAILT